MKKGKKYYLLFFQNDYKLLTNFFCSKKSTEECNFCVCMYHSIHTMNTMNNSVCVGVYQYVQ